MPKKKGAATAPTLDWIAEPLRPLAVAVAELTPDPANARRHPDRNLEAIRGSLKLYGQRKPLVVRQAGMVVMAGNGTLEAARALGWSHVACVVVDDDATTATGFAIADNRTGELAEWDSEALARLLDDLKAEDVPLADFGLADEEVAELLADLDLPTEEPGEDPLDTSSQLENPTFQVVIDCRDESDQAALLSELMDRGIPCRALIL